MSIYKPCDIRGDARRELTAGLYRRWGMALGERLPPGSPFVAGGDVRTSTPGFLEALVEGLTRSGLRVSNVGVLPTPMIDFARRHLKAAGYAIVTASHSPPGVNGLKWMVGGRPPDEQDVQSLRRAAEAPAGPARAPGPARTADVSEAYREWLAAAWPAPTGAAPAALRVVLDPGNGCWSGRAARCLGLVFPSARFEAIHDRPDGLFPERDPDCARPGHLHALSRAVVARRADLGVAFDGDGDRVAFVDGEGAALKAEEAALLLLDSFGPGLSGRAFVYDIKFSDRVPEAARALGARPLVERSGHAFIRARMLDAGALFGAEISGHYFYAELEGGDDGLFTACRMIARLAAAGRPLAELRRALPPVFVTPDLRLDPGADDPKRLLDRVRAAFAGRPQSSVDGVRVEFPGGWALARGSVTESKLTFRFEGESERRLDEIVREFCDALPGLGEELRRQYERARRADEPTRGGCP